LGFKDHLESVVIKHNGEQFEIDLNEYKSFLRISEGLNRDLKEVIHQIHISGEVPFLLGESFVMVNLSNGKQSPIKNRKQKELCGVVINSLVRTAKTQDQLVSIKESITWQVPDVVMAGHVI
jgi:hypothetical protein